MRQDLRHKYAMNINPDRRTQRIKALSASATRKYHNRAEARRAKQQIEADYQKLRKFDDDVVVVDKLSIKEEREPLRKQSGSRDRASLDEQIALVVQSSKSSLPEQLRHQEGDDDHSIQMISNTTEQDDNKAHNDNSAISSWANKNLDKATPRKPMFDRSPEIGGRTLKGKTQAKR